MTPAVEQARAHRSRRTHPLDQGFRRPQHRRPGCRGDVPRELEDTRAHDTPHLHYSCTYFDAETPQDVPAELTALINDTTGTLIASAYVNPKTRIAVIFGTGCNAAYMERVGSIPKIKNLGIDDDANMAINCEWVRDHTHTETVLARANELPKRVPLIRSNTNTSRGRNTIRS